MAERPKDVSEAELAILQVLWEEGPRTSRHLVERLYPPGGASANATVQKLLERLEAKGFVASDRSGPTRTVSATIGRVELLDRRLKAAADRLWAGSMASLLIHLVESWRLPAGERKALRDYLDGLGDPPRGEDGDTS